VNQECHKVPTPTADEYIDSDTDLYEDEQPDEVSPSPMIVQSGWDAARDALKKQERSSFIDDFKFSTEPQLVKFLSDSPYATYRQHWIDNRPGKKSFVCLEKDCPLCAIGDTPQVKVAFSVLNFSADTGPVVESLVASKTLAKMLEEFHKSDRTGPLTKNYFLLAKPVNNQTSFIVTPVKARDLAEDFGIDPVEAEEMAQNAEPLTAHHIRVTSRPELQEIAESL